MIAKAYLVTMLAVLTCLSAGCRLSKSPKPITTAPLVSCIINQPLHSLERFEGLPFDESAPVSLHESVHAAIVNFRHPSGLHTVRSPDCHAHSSIVLMPPGLTRDSQLEFYRDLHQRVFDAQIAYWNLSIAQARMQSVERQNILANRFLQLMQEKQDTDQATAKDVNAAKIQAIQIHEANLKQELSTDHGTINAAMEHFINTCGLPRRRYETIDQPDGYIATTCFDCDAAQLLCCNPELLVQRYQWIMATNGKKFDLRCIDPNYHSPDVPITVDDLVVESEKNAVSKLSDLREQLEKAGTALRLVDERIVIQQQQLDWTREEVEREENTADRLLIAELELERSLADKQQLIGQIQIINSTYSYRVGNLLVKLKVRFPDFWLAKVPEFCSNLHAAGCSGSGCTQTIHPSVVHPIESVGVIEYVEPMGNNDESAPELLFDPIEDPDLLPSIEAIE